MAVFEMVQHMEGSIPKLKMISEGNRGEFMTALYWWYKERSKYYYMDPPNIDDLLDTDVETPAYLEAVMDAVAATIIEREDWEPYSADSYGTAYEIINCNFEEFLSDVRGDVNDVFEALQLFHASGIITWDDYGNADWSAEVIHHSPLQEVW